MSINEDWTIIDNQLSVDDNQALESIFSLGNGYLGVRGSYEDDAISDRPTTHGTFINGFYETAPIEYGEQAYGYPYERQSMISLPDATNVELQLDGLPVDNQNGTINDNVRWISFKTGLLTHSFTWVGKLSGKKIRVTYTRMVSHKRKHILAMELIVKPLNFKHAILTINSSINTSHLTVHSSKDPRFSDINPAQLLKNAQPLGSANPQIMGLAFSTVNSRLTTLIGVIHSLDGDIDPDTNTWQKRLLINQKPVVLDKYACYFDTREPHEKSALASVEKELVTCHRDGFEALQKEQRFYLRQFWRASDIHIANNYHSDFQLATRFALFQLLQSVGKDGRRGIGAKGLSGTGYDGHYFWDTEIYIIPFFTMTQPQIARSLLVNRYNQLEQSIRHAGELGYAGALFPWRTINGQESSAYFPASTAAIHIDADIMFAVQQYYYFTDDQQFMRQYGLRMLVETSRFYMSFGNWDEQGRFVINTVTGPDEYTALVNNNAYTNLMVKNMLEFLTDSFALSQVMHFGVTQEEWNSFKKAAADMYIVKNGDLIGQDDSFLSKSKLDLKRIKPDQYPLLLHFHPMFLYQHQVLKQADLILAIALMPQRFSPAQQRVNYDYYEPLTTHDSSLSRCAYAIVASRLPNHQKFDRMLAASFKTDLEDSQHNTANGLHTASMGGTWLVILLGLAHVQATEQKLIVDPILPHEWNAYVVYITYHGSQLKLSVSKRGAHVTLMHGKEVEVELNGELVKFSH